MTHKTKQAALKAARTALGDEAIEGVDFNLKQTGAGWTHEEIPPATDAAAEAQGKRLALQPTDEEVRVSDPELGGTMRKMTPAAASAAGYIEAKDISGAEVWTKPDSPMLVDGVIYPNKTRATEAVRLREQRAAEPAPAHGPTKTPKAAKPPAKVKAKAAPKKTASAKPVAPEGKTKADVLTDLLKGSGGATSKEMEEATGWQPHSVRGFLGTLRKKGVNVISKKLPNEPTIYRIGAAVATEPVGDVV